MREDGLEEAIRAAGGIGVLARALGISQPAVSNWQRIPAERVLAVEALTGVRAGAAARPLPECDERSPTRPRRDEIDLLRSHEYGLLRCCSGARRRRTCWRASPSLQGRREPARPRPYRARRGGRRGRPGRGLAGVLRPVRRRRRGASSCPTRSYYLTGFLHERPLARVREDLARLGIERVEASASRRTTSPSCAR